MTVGAQRPVVLIYSGLAASYDADEVQAILAHELGHVLSEHYLLHDRVRAGRTDAHVVAPGGVTGLPVDGALTWPCSSGSLGPPSCPRTERARS